MTDKWTALEKNMSDSPGLLVSEWISVKDRMPEHEQPILFVIRGGSNPYVAKGVRNWDGEFWWWCDEDGVYDEMGNDGEHSYVTHWMPLPAAPPATKEQT